MDNNTLQYICGCLVTSRKNLKKVWLFWLVDGEISQFLSYLQKTSWQMIYCQWQILIQRSDLAEEYTMEHHTVPLDPTFGSESATAYDWYTTQINLFLIFTFFKKNTQINSYKSCNPHGKLGYLLSTYSCIVPLTISVMLTTNLILYILVKTLLMRITLSNFNCKIMEKSFWFTKCSVHKLF